MSVAELSRSIRKNVINAIEQMTALEVVEVNIAVNDVHLPGEDDTSPASDRVE